MMETIRWMAQIYGRFRGNPKNASPEPGHIVGTYLEIPFEKQPIMTRMASIVLIGICACLPGESRAEAVDELFSMKCSGFFALDISLLNNDARQAYLATLHSWIIFSEALGIDPDVEATCKADPDMSVEDAMKRALANTRN